MPTGPFIGGTRATHQQVALAGPSTTPTSATGPALAQDVHPRIAVGGTMGVVTPMPHCMPVTPTLATPTLVTTLLLPQLPILAQAVGRLVVPIVSTHLTTPLHQLQITTT